MLKIERPTFKYKSSVVGIISSIKEASELIYTSFKYSPLPVKDIGGENSVMLRYIL